MPSPRWREIAGDAGLAGVLEPGPHNAITDVPGVSVGHAQAESGERTGVTVISPRSLPAPAGFAVVNGTGELTGSLEVAERGVIETPVYLCGSHALGTVHHAAVLASGRGPENIVLPVVGECDDGEMADSRTITVADVERALADLDAPGSEVAEGSVGAGTGMSCFDFPGGIGTASRKLGEHHVGVLLLCNFGDREYLDLLGTRLEPAPARPPSQGSCIAVCATDAPLNSAQLRRLALRPLLGLARAGSFGSEGSGEIGLAFGTGDTDAGGLSWAELNGCFAAAFEAGHEAVFNCLVAARPGVRLDGSDQDGFPIESVRRLVGRSVPGD